MIAERLETLKQGRPGKDANLHVSREDAAKKLNVGERIDIEPSANLQKVSRQQAASMFNIGQRTVSIEAACGWEQTGKFAALL